LPKRLAPCIVAVMWAGLVLTAVIAADVAAGSLPAFDAACPADADVEAELARVGAGQSVHPEIEILGSQMRVVLRGQDGSTLGSREVEAPTSCRERATVAAVLVATWIGTWPRGAENPSPASTRTVTTPPTGSPVPPPERRRTEIGLTFVGAYDGNAAGLGAVLEVRRTLIGPIRGFVMLSGTTERDRTIRPGAASYMRPALEVGPALDLGRGSIRGEIGISGRLGLMLLHGKDLPVTHDAIHVVPGMGSNLRLIFAGKRFSPFLLAGGAYWLADQTVTLDHDPSTAASPAAQLPRWDVQVGVGVFWAP
jgi:hypothetical protein